MALLLTCLSGSFPLITAPPIKAVSFASLSRWGVEALRARRVAPLLHGSSRAPGWQQALYANEMSPFYYGEPSLRGRGTLVVPAEDCNARCSIAVLRPNQAKPNILQADQVLLATGSRALRMAVLEPWYEVDVAGHRRAVVD